MNVGRARNLTVPLVLLVAWAAIYLPWARRHPAVSQLPIDRLPPAVLVWPQPAPPNDPPEVAAMKREIEALQAALIDRYRAEAALRPARADRRPRATPGDVTGGQ